MKVRVDYGDGTEPEEIEVSDGSMHFHPFPEGDTEKHEVSVEVLEEDEVPEVAPEETASEEASGESPDIEAVLSGTVSEVQAWATANPDYISELYEAETAGANRSTLVNWLEQRVPFDPSGYTVTQVIGYAEDYPEEIDAIIAAEQAGKNRTTLINQLESLRSA
jgi:hypothetical protein